MILFYLLTKPIAQYLCDVRNFMLMTFEMGGNHVIL